MSASSELTPGALLGLSRERVEDAKALLRVDRFHGAVYLSGYAVELALKARICKTLNWTSYPQSGGFQGLQSFRTHDLDILLKLSGIENQVRQDSQFMGQWSIVKRWNPETRYNTLD